MVLERGICHPTHDALCVCTCIFTPTCVPVLHVCVYKCTLSLRPHVSVYRCICTHLTDLQIVRMIRTVHLFLHMAGNQDKLSYMYMYNTTERVIATTHTAKRGHLPVPTGWAQERTGTLTDTIRLVLS